MMHNEESSSDVNGGICLNRGIADLPEEILDVIFQPLSFTDKQCLRQVCLIWYHVLNHPRHYRHLSILASDIPLVSENSVGPSCPGSIRSFQESLETVAPFIEEMTVLGRPRADNELSIIFSHNEIFHSVHQLILNGGSSTFATLTSCLPRSITQVTFKDFTFSDRLLEPLSLGCIPFSYHPVHVQGEYVMHVTENDDEDRSGLKCKLLQLARTFYSPVNKLN